MADKVKVEYELELAKLKKQFKDFKKELQDIKNKGEKSAKGVEGAFNKVGDSIKKIGTGLLAAFTVGALVQFGKELTRTAIEIETFGRRARTVFGAAFKEVDDFAKKTAKSLGFTRNEFLGAAAAIGDILVPLGLSRQAAANMSVEAVKLGAAIKEFTGDQRSAAEISQIVAKAFTGEVEGLKALQVVVNQNSEEFKALVLDQRLNEGATLSQAKAVAIFEGVLKSSADSLRIYREETGSLSRSQAELGANLRELKEVLATAITPALKGATSAALNWFNALNDADTIIEKVGLTIAPVALVMQLFKRDTDELAESLEEVTAQIDSWATQLVKTGFFTKEQIRNVFFLDATLTSLRATLKDQNASLQDNRDTIAEINLVQAEMNALMGKTKKETEKVDETFKKLTKTLNEDFKDAIKSASDDIDEFILKTQEENEAANEAGERRIRSFLAVEDARRELFSTEVELAQKTISIFQGVAEEGSTLAKVLFAFEQALAVANIIVNLQREISAISANPFLSLSPEAGVIKKAALIAVAKTRAATGVATVIGTTVATVAGFEKGTTDAPEGMAWVGEKGPELMMIPKGSHVYSNQASNKYKDELDAANRGDLENLITSKYIVPALRQSTQIRNEWDDSNLLREGRRLRREGSPIANADYLAKKIAKEMKQENVTQRLYGG